MAVSHFSLEPDAPDLMVATHDHDHAEPPIRIDVRDASLNDIDWRCPSLGARDLALLESLQRERRLRVDLGMDLQAEGLEAAMLIVWHTAITPDIPVGAPASAVRETLAARVDDRPHGGNACSRDWP